MAARWVAIWCVECTPMDERGRLWPYDAKTFDTARARAWWAVKHRSTTGHDRLWVLDCTDVPQESA